MAGIANGIASYKGMKPITGTFLSFADYEKPALRLGCIMKAPTLSFFSHDSLFVGEDGPTHQPVDQIPMLRSIPNMTLFRPYNSQELNYAFEWYVNNQQPTTIVTTRQDLSNEKTNSKNISKGGYVILKEKKEHRLTLVASGSEVSLLLEVIKKLNSKNIRLVSIPSLNLLSKQSAGYINELVPKDIETHIFEATSDYSWLSLFPHAKMHIINTFGSSGKGDEVYEKYGFNGDKLVTFFDKYLK